MVNKGRIQKEIGNFFRYSSNSIKLDDELWREIRDFSRFGKKKTTRRIHGIKNHSIWISIHGEIKEQNLGRNFDHEEREFDKVFKN